MAITSVPLTASGSGKIDPPSPGHVIYLMASAGGLLREEDELHRAVRDAAQVTEPLVIVVEGATELREDELQAALRASQLTPQDVILTIRGDG